MMRLAQHIGTLLLDNDCVIVPGLGGFVAHYIPARVEDNLFIPPARVVGFNSLLKMNDGMLAQSYMSVFNTSFADATRMIEKEVEKVFAALHEEGRVELPDVGELRYSIHDTYEFASYGDKIMTPGLYGLDCFEMKELSALEQPVGKKIMPLSAANAESRGRRFRINASYLWNAAAMIAAVVVFFLSTPVENTEMVEEDYARLLPGELFEKIEKQSLVITPIVVSRTMSGKKNAVPEYVQYKSTVQSVVTVEGEENDIAFIPVSASKEVDAHPLLPYHIIVASVGTEADAEVMAMELVRKGFAEAKAIIGDGRKRVCIQSYGTESEAYQALNKIRLNETYQNAWVLKK